jgi:hypothetical protein
MKLLKEIDMKTYLSVMVLLSTTMCLAQDQVEDLSQDQTADTSKDPEALKEEANRLRSKIEQQKNELKEQAEKIKDPPIERPKDADQPMSETEELGSSPSTGGRNLRPLVPYTPPVFRYPRAWLTLSSSYGGGCVSVSNQSNLTAKTVSNSSARSVVSVKNSKPQVANIVKRKVGKAAKQQVTKAVRARTKAVAVRTQTKAVAVRTQTKAVAVRTQTKAVRGQMTRPNFTNRFTAVGRQSIKPIGFKMTRK